MPDFCMKIIKEYSGQLYGLRKHDRIFPTNKYFLSDKMTRGSDSAEIKHIRIHDLRHSHASLLINMGVSILLISERLGHENIETTLRTYSHLYPSTIKDTVKQLETLHENIANSSQNIL